jgi:hypothetical protein
MLRVSLSLEKDWVSFSSRQSSPVIRKLFSPHVKLSPPLSEALADKESSIAKLGVEPEL